ncbi:hypothetical protein ELQ35_10940 [Peribacillus cavernae]|uniref:Uncharacterized protein n=1 Tax=Peribacillus cavernae TaxID=1674310 RepID=A0A433HL65_9BACI|nr:hypothetical protein [Peribacillus cavernae]MDQ0217989.1 hypothetical protein [Peribacillus cavernae]RUQ28963.1 hypothetical protein ELQ35_10940 [Peribacillus cavernae]
MKQSFPFFCYTFNRSCPEPDININITDLIDSPPEITELENALEKRLRMELERLGGIKPLREIRKTKKRPSIESRILRFK